MSDPETLRNQIAKLDAQIEALKSERGPLRIELANATAPYKVGDILDRMTIKDRNRKRDRWIVDAINPGTGGDDFSIVLRNVRVDGSAGTRTSNYYSFYTYVKVEPTSAGRGEPSDTQ